MIPTVSEKIPGPSAIPLYVETYGNPEAEQTVLLLHGGLQSVRCFRKQFTSLSKHAYVIAPDLPYHGQSGPVSAWVQPSPALWAQSVRAVLTHYHRLEKPLVIAAWSFGGLVTHHYLLTYGQQNINGLILVGSLFGGITAYQPFSPLAAQVAYTMAAPQVVFSERLRAFEQFVAMLTHHPLDPDASNAQYGYNAKAFLQSLHTTDWLAELPCDRRQFLGQLQMPVLLIQGTDDALVAPLYTRQIASALPYAQVLEYEDCGHSPFLEQPERFNRDVEAFLARCRTEEAAIRSVGDAA